MAVRAWGRVRRKTPTALGPRCAVKAACLHLRLSIVIFVGCLNSPPSPPLFLRGAGGQFSLAPAHTAPGAGEGAAPATGFAHLDSYAALFGPPDTATLAELEALQPPAPREAAVAAARCCGRVDLDDVDEAGSSGADGEPEPDDVESEGDSSLGNVVGLALGEGPGGATPAELALRESQLHWWRNGWLPGGNPLGIPTEREVDMLERGGSVYRVLLVKN